jgi:hypothetical protein
MAIAFADIVKKTVSKELGCEGVTISKGSGPVIEFKPHISETIQEIVYFQKSQYDDSFYVEIGFFGVMPIRESQTMNVHLRGNTTTRLEGLVRRGDSTVYASKDELINALTIICKKLPACMAKERPQWMANRQAFEDCGVKLLKLYSTWYPVKDGYICPQNLIKQIETTEQMVAILENSVDDPKELEPYIRFIAYLVQEKHLPFSKLSSDCANMHEWLWQFWHFGRPMKKDDYPKIKDCGRCGNYKSKGIFVDKTDPVFGPWQQFVCQKCSSK